MERIEDLENLENLENLEYLENLKIFFYFCGKIDNMAVIPPAPISAEEHRKGLIQLHLSVFLAGFTGLFGKLITLNEVDIVWYRMMFTTMILLVFTGIPRIGWRKVLLTSGCGTLLGLHWILFYASIKASNVSIGVVCFATVGFFTALLEPLIHHHRVSVRELALSLITLAGIACIFSFDARYRTGICIGLVSSVVCTLYIIYNKDVSSDLRAREVLFWQMAGGLLGTTIIIPLYLSAFPSSQPVVVIPEGTNLWLMLCHALFCTVGMYLLQIMALKRLSAFTVNLTYNLEPCYAIVWAFLFLGEARQLNAAFYVGIALVVISVVLTGIHKQSPKTRQ